MQSYRKSTVAGTAAMTSSGVIDSDRIEVRSEVVSHNAARSVASETFYTMVTNAVIAVLGLSTGVLAARMLGSVGRGELAAIQTWPTVIATLSMVGLADALIYFSARDPRSSGSSLVTATTLGLLFGSIGMVIAYMAMPFLLAGEPAGVIWYARMYLFIVPVFAINWMPFNLLRGIKQLTVWNLLRPAPYALWLLALLIAIVRHRPDPGFIATWYLVFTVLMVVPVALVVRFYINGPFRLRPSNFGPMLRFGLPSSISGVPQILNARMDQMLMAALLPPQLLGLYVVAVSWSGAAQPLFGAIGAVQFPTVASERREDRQAFIISRTTRVTVLLAIVITAALMFITARALPLIFGAQFSASVPSALVLLIAGAVLATNSVLEEGLKGLGLPKAVMWAEAAGLIVTIISLLLMLKPMGIMGAALASLFGYSTVGIALIAGLRTRTGFSISSLILPDMVDVTFLVSLTKRLIWS